MPRLSDIRLPSSKSLVTRLSWGGDRFNDLCEGALTSEQGWYIWNVIVGWADLATEDERRQYLTLSKCYSDLLNS